MKPDAHSTVNPHHSVSPKSSNGCAINVAFHPTDEP